MSIITTEINTNGRIHVYIFGFKIFSYRINKTCYSNISLKQIKNIQSQYKKIENLLKLKVKNNKQIKVAFLVGLSHMFPAKSLMENMIKSNIFKVSIIIIPDLRFGTNEAMQIQNQTILELQKYKDITIIAPIIEKEDNIILKNYADIVVPSLPYDISHKKYDLLSIIKNDILPIIINYGFFRSLYDRNNLISKPIYSLFWKVFVETKYNLEEFNKYSLIKGKNTVLSGYCKMDTFVNKNKQTNDKKVIMIAPHHSLTGGFNNILSLSNFDRYAELFLSLPDMYPNINFIFRPHPALFLFLSKNENWGNEKVNSYILKMKSKKNVIYSNGGDYFEEFSQSDALIDDCGSYLVEYFYTQKPQCYLLKKEADINNKFIEFGKKCLSYCYIAYNEKDIIQFIEDVVIRENDIKKDQRIHFAKENIMYNYQYASDNIIQYFKNIFEIH